MSLPAWNYPIVSKNKQKCGSNLEQHPVFKALRRADPEQNARTIPESNPEHLHESVKFIWIKDVF